MNMSKKSRFFIFAVNLFFSFVFRKARSDFNEALSLAPKDKMIIDELKNLKVNKLTSEDMCVIASWIFFVDCGRRSCQETNRICKYSIPKETRCGERRYRKKQCTNNERRRSCFGAIF
jgi:hypothetical protein